MIESLHASVSFYLFFVKGMEIATLINVSSLKFELLYFYSPPFQDKVHRSQKLVLISSFFIEVVHTFRNRLLSLRSTRVSVHFIDANAPDLTSDADPSALRRLTHIYLLCLRFLSQPELSSCSSSLLHPPRPPSALRQRFISAAAIGG